MPEITISYNLYFELSIAIAHRIAECDREIRAAIVGGNEGAVQWVLAQREKANAALTELTAARDAAFEGRYSNVA
jgi:lipocalin